VTFNISALEILFTYWLTPHNHTTSEMTQTKQHSLQDVCDDRVNVEHGMSRDFDQQAIVSVKIQ